MSGTRIGGCGKGVSLVKADTGEPDVEVRGVIRAVKGVGSGREGGGIDSLSASPVKAMSSVASVGLVELERDERDGAPMCGLGTRLFEVFAGVGMRFFGFVSVFLLSYEHFRLLS